MILGGMGSVTVTAATLQPPLLQKMTVLHCTTDIKVAEKTLDTLFNISAKGYEWPDEWLGETQSSPALHAGTLDIMLHTLKNTVDRFPSLRETVERVTLQWNYCDVLEDAQFFDLNTANSHLQKNLADTNVPLQWQGFREWGFLTPDPPERFVPQLLDEIRIAPTAYQYFLHRIYRLHCFPHPETGLLATEAEAAPPVLFSRVPPMNNVVTDAITPYPYAWDPICEVPKPKLPPLIKPPVRITRAPEPKPESPPSVPPTPAAKSNSAATTAADTTQRAANNTAAPQTAPAANQPPPATANTTPAPPVVTIPDPSANAIAGLLNNTMQPTALPLLTLNDTLISTQPTDSHRHTVSSHATTPQTAAKQTSLPPAVIPAKAVHPVNGYTVMPTIAPSVAGNDIPIFFDEETLEAMAEQEAKAQGKKINKTKKSKNNKKKKLNLAGTIADTYSLKDGSNTLSASATWSPKENWFINGNVSMKDGKLGYSWGAGYSDWRPGTWSAQVNNYGPIKPGKGLDLKGASASVGYKIKSDKLDKHKLNASLGANISGEGKASVNGTLQWNPKPKWYARTTASVSADGGLPNWSYGFGYSDPRPGKWRVEYSNYGSNKFPGDNLKDGSITISRGWQF